MQLSKLIFLLEQSIFFVRFWNSFIQNFYLFFPIRVLRNGGQLVAVHAGRFFKTPQGYAVGPGFVTKGLEYSTGVTQIVIGKPDPLFFKSGIPQGIEPSRCVMIGDDPVDDIEGAKKLGMQTILVKTGKYAGFKVPPEVDTVMANDFEHAVDLILNSK